VTTERPLSALVCALGGQGGGLLVDWLVEAAHLSGYPAQATSIPGVAQRTGATTYYLEVFPQKAPPADPVFCLFPSHDDVDLVASLEPMEAGRAWQAGHVTARTTVITAAARVYAISEKIVPGDGSAAAAPVLEALEAAGKRLIVLDGANGGGPANAVLFGAIVGTGILPLDEPSCRNAITEAGVATDANLAGFAAGLDLARQPVAPTAPLEETDLDPAPEAFAADFDAFPEAMRPVIGHAVARLVDYQDAAYARTYLGRLQALLAADRAAAGNGCRLTALTAPRLAAWMAFEDVARVAQLKTRPGRLASIRKEMGAGPGDHVRIAEYLRPGLGELRGMLPTRLARLVPPPRPGQPRRGPRLRVPTSSPPGYAILKALAMLRRWRPRTARFAEEQALIERFFDAVGATAGRDYDLACRAVELTDWVRGYGDVRERGLARVGALLTDWRERLDREPEALAADLAAAVDAARSDPDAGSAPAA
jgi:indolepyruvate ferredoxin oxidoreductase beta subunit